MAEKAPVFDKIIDDYLHQVAGIAAKQEVAETLGISVVYEGFRIPFFSREYTVSNRRIHDGEGKSAPHGVSVVLCQYLLLCPERPSNDFSLVTYKDFKNAAPYVGGSTNTAEQAIAKHFEGYLQSLERECLQLGGSPYETEVSCQLAYVFQALPKVPLVLLFNDVDEDFPAQATLLFQKNAASFMDMECLAMIGATLANRLQQNSNREEKTSQS